MFNKYWELNERRHTSIAEPNLIFRNYNWTTIDSNADWKFKWSESFDFRFENIVKLATGIVVKSYSDGNF